MKKNRTWLSVIALALICVMMGTVMGTVSATGATAETQTVVVTSPFTEAVKMVRDSVVGVSNYQSVRYSNSSSWPYGYGNSYGYGFGYGYGYGYGNDRGNNSYTEQEVLSATGSGVVIAEEYILTNYHVVEDAKSLYITTADMDTEDKTYPATVVAKDENLDVAVLYAPGLPLKAVTLGDSDTLQVGDWAICIGNPLSNTFTNTVTAGIVSGINRSISSNSTDKYGRKETITNTMIQTDAAINNGNSGGGMFSVTGELMGIPTLKYSGSAYSGASIDGIGMCIPINAAKPLISDVLAGKYEIVAPEAPAATTSNNLTGKPRMGITISGMNKSSAAVASGSLPNGVYVSEVEENAPADKAGMQAGDIIVDVNDTVISSTSQLQSILAEKNVGDKLNVKVYRVPGITSLDSNSQIPDGEYIDLVVELAIVDDIKQ